MNTAFTFFRILTVFVLGGALNQLSAQDIHFSQYLNSPMNLGPGMTGVFGGDLRFSANYRNQWSSVPVPYTTFSGVVENKYYPAKGLYNRFLTGGLMLNWDRQGDLHLTSLQVGIPVSYTLPLSAKNNQFFTLGVLPTFGQRSFGRSGLSFDSQWVDALYDPNADPKETGLFAAGNLKYFDLSGGANYRWQGIGKRTKIDAGIGLHHINRPHHDFWEGEDNVRLHMRTAGYLSALIQAGYKFDLVGQGLYQVQGGYREFAFGGGVRFYLNQNPYQELAVQLGLNYRQRYNDAIIPHVEVHWRTWTLGFSYDINLSDAKIITNRRGGPEVALIYRLYRVKPLGKFKSCPII